MLDHEFEMEERRLYYATMSHRDFEYSKVFRSDDKVFYLDNVTTEYMSWDYLVDFMRDCTKIEVT